VYLQNLGSALTDLIMLPLWGQFRSISINTSDINNLSLPKIAYSNIQGGPVHFTVSVKPQLFAVLFTC